jgi:polyisoprenyl-phosphate glycosyltransferase
MKVSICIPVYNGSLTIENLVKEVIEELKCYELEIILVNDGSSDNSEEVCENIAKTRKNIKFISLRKNFGEHNAVMCALNFVTGDYAAIIDDDFQNPPREIITLLNKAQEGFDVVYSKYDKKKHQLWRNMGSRFNDMIATLLIDKPRNLYLSSFKVINREVINEIIKYKGPFPYIDGLIFRVTNNYDAVLVEHSTRREGKSNYTISKLIKLWLNMFINFSVKPLRIFAFIGMFFVFISFLAAVYIVIEKIMHPDVALGWASTMLALIFFSGTQLMFMGLMSEYIGKSYLDQNGTPQWIIKKNIEAGDK